MSRTLPRGGSLRFSQDTYDFSEDSQRKERIDKECVDRNSKNDTADMHLPFAYLYNSRLCTKLAIKDNGFASDPSSPGLMRNRQGVTLSLLKYILTAIAILALIGSFWWTLSITSASRGKVHRGYRQLKEHLVSDLYEIGDLSLSFSRSREVYFCSHDFENYVPCFNISENLAHGFYDGKEYDRHCEHATRQNCLVLPPVNYKNPLRWPTGRDVIWLENVQITAQEVLSSGSLNRRMMMMDDNQVSFHSESSNFGIEDYAHQIAEIIGERNVSYFTQAGIRTILDIECGYGSLGAHLSKYQLLTMCVANYEPSGSQIQLTLERGVPAMIGSFRTKQLPYPSFSFDMVHCWRCHVEWDKKGGLYLVEVDRLLRPGGYFVWTDPLVNSQRTPRKKDNIKKWNAMRLLTDNLCWEMLPQQDGTAVWKKTSKKSCYAARKTSSPPLCSKDSDVESPYYRNLQTCIGGTLSRRWIPIQARRKWPTQAQLNTTEIGLHGLSLEEFSEDALKWKTDVVNYWSLLSPVIFSDHPKRPGDEDPSPPYNMLRNVLDMNARFGGFNAALLESGKSVWVMNVIPTRGPNTLPLVVDRGFVGLLHDWCEPLPTYSRTYDLIHAQGLLSLEFSEKPRCQMMDLFIEMDRILRPEGWVILKDVTHAIDLARTLVTRLKWDARIIDIESNNDEKLLICQKPFLKQQLS